MRGKEKRLGYQRAVIVVVDHPLGPIRAVGPNLDAYSSQSHRRHQMNLVLDYLDSLKSSLPVVIGGD